MKIAVLPGDGIGPEIIAQARRVLDQLDLRLDFSEAPVGGAAYERQGDPLPEKTLSVAKEADAVLFGAVGDPRYDKLERAKRPEQAILGLRKELGLFANLRPALVYAELASASALKPEVVAGLDILIVRELTGDIYFGQPKGIRKKGSEREGFDTMRYAESEIRRIARVAFDAARKRSKRVCSVDKANVLETSQLWRTVVTRLAADYPDVTLQHMYVDACAMALVTSPSRFDVVLTENLFGDILSDEAAVIAGSIGLLPSASIGDGPGLFEPVHGSAPDIAGRDLANPIGAIASAAMLVEHSLGAIDEARAIDAAIDRVLTAGHRTADLAAGGPQVSCSRMAELIAAAVAD
jgi:3-isopropylmalate dehydrogenase